MARVGDEFAWRAEARDGADLRRDRESEQGADAGDGVQQRDARVGARE